jgi:hypothetical protein
MNRQNSIRCMLALSVVALAAAQTPQETGDKIAGATKSSGR